jgi:hypothetical protein
MACEPLIPDEFVFPRRADNRPGLPRIGYRIGRYGDFREAMLRSIDAAEALAAWTHREADDPGIALIEGAAILGDILSFYQEHYANEAYLRTAAWRDSVADLVRLTGYRLTPGIGGRATFAVELRGTRPVTIRAGFPVKVDLADVPLPADFQSTAEVIAYPALGRFNLYRQRIPAPVIAARTTTIELTAVGGATDSLTLAAFDLKAGDQLMLVPAEGMYSVRGAWHAQGEPQTVAVSKVTHLLGRVIVELEFGPSVDWLAPVRAYRIGRSFRHFGHNAPPNVVTPVVDGTTSEVTGSTSVATEFTRTFNSGADPFGVGILDLPLATEVTTLAASATLPVASSAAFTSAALEAPAVPLVARMAATASPPSGVAFFEPVEGVIDLYVAYSPYTALTSLEFPLDVEAPEIAAGRTVLIQGTVRFDGQGSRVAFVVSRSLASSRGRTVQWGNVTGASTVLMLDGGLFLNTTLRNAKVDIRELRFHETRGPELTLRPLTGFASGAFLNGTNVLWFYGTAEEARPLAGRRLHLAHADGRNLDLVCTNPTTAFAATAFAATAFAANSPAPRMWPLSFDRAPAPFTRNDFTEDAPTVAVYGNLFDATQGKAEPEAVLGNGDNRQDFQTFPLPKAPLTYFLASDATPPHRPELEILVGGRVWTRVDVFFGRGPKDEVYIVREDAEGRSYVQFGDGRNGARLPSGVGNVVAVYRSGSGARGPIKPGAVPTAPERPVGFDKVTLAGIVAGGADPEDAERARVAAPGKVQSLGRIVSLRDYETETLAIPGVVAASARWDLHEGVPAVLLGVLLAAGREAEFEAVRAAVAHAQRCRGPDRHPLIVRQALLRYVFLDLEYARDPTWRADAVRAAVRAVLGLAGVAADERSGVFGLYARTLGAREYASRIEGRVQNVAGVLWCRVGALGRFAGGARDPGSLALPAAPRIRLATLPCSAYELLQLDARHLSLIEAAAPAAGECA